MKLIDYPGIKELTLVDFVIASEKRFNELEARIKLLEDQLNNSSPIFTCVGDRLENLEDEFRAYL